VVGRREEGKEEPRRRMEEGGRRKEEGGKEGRREGRKEGRREGGKEGRREGGKEGRREGGKEGRREGGKEEEGPKENSSLTPLRIPQGLASVSLAVLTPQPYQDKRNVQWMVVSSRPRIMFPCYSTSLILDSM
jgi:hypothetical protein